MKPESYLHPSHRIDDDIFVPELLKRLHLTREQRERIHAKAQEMVLHVRAQKKNTSNWVDSFMDHFRLDQREGQIVMALAEALIRIPDDAKPGHRLTCTHCNTPYYAWQLLARSYRPEVKPNE